MIKARRPALESKIRLAVVGCHVGVRGFASLDQLLDVRMAEIPEWQFGEVDAETDGRKGLRSLEILIASSLAARDGRRVALPLEY